MKKLWAIGYKLLYGVYPIGGGGGSKAQPAQVIQMPAQPPAPSAGQSAEDLYAAQVKYNPQLYQQYMQAYGQYMPQVAGVDIGIQQQYAPQIKALQEQMYPQQTQLTEALASQALQRFQSPFGYSPQEQAALEAIRGRTREQVARQTRERANLGGGLYSGRAETQENRMLSELEQAFAAEDINRRLMGGQQALQYATPVLQMQYPQVQQPQMPNYWQGVTPSADQLYQAIYGAGRRDYAVQPAMAGTPSPMWNIAGQVAGGAAMGLALSSIRYKKNIKLWAKPLNCLNN